MSPFEKIGRRITDFLSNHEKRLSVRQKKTSFSIIMASVSLYFLSLLLSPVLNREPTGKYRLPLPQKITTPQDISLPDSLDIRWLKEQELIKKLKDTS